ncbi:MAG TPA: hypothetical protein VFD43_10890, partial [Planctomycetota bacterium]|nr:hypothetical protein [Planctomycetota bacterium]
SDGAVVAWGHYMFNGSEVPALPPGLVWVEVESGWNHTVARAAQAPLWAELGYALAGSAGEPSLSGDGTLQPDSVVQLSLADARPLAFAVLVVGSSPLYAPFKGGVMVPDADFLLPMLTDPLGGALLGGRMPPGTQSGHSTYFQWWIQDPAGPKGFAASNALAGTTP